MTFSSTAKTSSPRYAGIHVQLPFSLFTVISQMFLAKEIITIREAKGARRRCRRPSAICSQIRLSDSGTAASSGGQSEAPKPGLA